MTPSKHKVNIIRSEYILPCDPLTLIKFMNHEQEQMNLDKNLEKFTVLE
jgi:hypothetical protein